MSSSFYFCIYSTSGGTVNFLILSCQTWFGSARAVRNLYAPLNKPLIMKRSWTRANPITFWKVTPAPIPERNSSQFVQIRQTKNIRRGQEEKERGKRSTIEFCEHMTEGERDSAEGGRIGMVLGNCTVLASDTQMWNSWMFSLKELCKNGSAIFLPPFRQANWKRKKIEWFWPSFKEQEFCFHKSFRFQKLILFWIAMKPADCEILCKGEF